MAWAKPEYSKNRVTRAGELLRQTSGQVEILERAEAISVVNNWRSAHGFPLNTMQMLLRRRVKRVVQKKGDVTQRLKRFPAIVEKLIRWDGMKLAAMHDIGGCRAVLPDIEAVDEIVDIYASGRDKHTQTGRVYDYIHSPKSDGYRGVHLVYRYHSDQESSAPWNGLRIEVQFRSRLQHAWAAAVETIDLFTGQTLKTGGGDESWKRFFSLMGSVLAEQEGTEPVPGTPEDRDELVRELRDLRRELSVETYLQMGPGMVTRAPLVKGDAYYIVAINAESKTIRAWSFKQRQTEQAVRHLDIMEREFGDSPNVRVVLAQASSFAEIQRGYPSYFADTKAFHTALVSALA